MFSHRPTVATHNKEIIFGTKQCANEQNHAKKRRRATRHHWTNTAHHLVLIACLQLVSEGTPRNQRIRNSENDERISLLLLATIRLIGLSSVCICFRCYTLHRMVCCLLCDFESASNPPVPYSIIVLSSSSGIESAVTRRRDEFALSSLLPTLASHSLTLI